MKLTIKIRTKINFNNNKVLNKLINNSKIPRIQILKLTLCLHNNNLHNRLLYKNNKTKINNKLIVKTINNNLKMFNSNLQLLNKVSKNKFKINNNLLIKIF